MQDACRRSGGGAGGRWGRIGGRGPRLRAAHQNTSILVQYLRHEEDSGQDHQTRVSEGGRCGWQPKEGEERAEGRWGRGRGRRSRVDGFCPPAFWSGIAWGETAHLRGEENPPSTPPGGAREGRCGGGGVRISPMYWILRGLGKEMKRN